MENVKSNKLFIPFILLLIGTILMTVTMFLPYSKAIDDHADYLKRFEDKMFYEPADMTGKDMMRISMVEYAKVYNKMDADGEIYIALLAMLGVFSALALLLSVKKKPIGVLIFGLLAFGVFSLHRYDFVDRGVIPSDSYAWGLGYYVFYVAAIMVLIGAIWMIVCKAAMKKSEANIPLGGDD